MDGRSGGRCIRSPRPRCCRRTRRSTSCQVDVRALPPATIASFRARARGSLPSSRRVPGPSCSAHAVHGTGSSEKHTERACSYIRSCEPADQHHPIRHHYAHRTSHYTATHSGSTSTRVERCRPGIHACGLSVAAALGRGATWARRQAARSFQATCVRR